MKAIMMLLLTKGVDVNIQGGQFGTALQAAAYRGDKDIVQLCLMRVLISMHKEESSEAHCKQHHTDTRKRCEYSARERR